MSDKQIKIPVSVDTVQAKKDLDSLLTSAKQPIQIGLKTDSTEAIKSVKDIQNEFKLLQSQFQLLKINGDTSGFNSIKSQVQDLSNKLKDIPKLDIKGQIQSQNIDNGLAKIKKEVKDIQSGKIDIQAYLTGSFKNDIASIKNSINSIPRQVTVGLVVAGISNALNMLGQLAGALKNLGGNFLSEGYEYVKDIESSATSLGLVLSNQATSQNKANAAFAEGKGTLEDYATITGRTTESLYETTKASGGAGGATKSLKADTIGLKGELLELKKTTQEYNRDIKYQESLKKELEKTTKYLVKGYKSQIDSIQDVILGMENQEKASLVRTNSTDREIKDIERLIKTKQLEIDIDEKKLDKDKSKQEKSFDKNNKPVLDDIAKKEIQLDKKSLEIQKRKNLLDNNPTANAGALAQIKNEEEAIREQTSALRIQKDEIRLKRQELVLNIENQQENQRNLIENKKEELDKNKEIADAKKNQNEAIKNQFEVQIDDQKKLIDGLKDKIEKANIKLDLDTKPIQDKIDSIKQKITDLQEQSQDIQTEISDRQQAASEANTGGGGGGGGGGGKIPIVDPKKQAEIDKLNAEKKAKAPITKEEVQNKLNQILESSTKYAADTPFEKKDVLNLAAQTTTLGFNPLAGAKNGDISEAGYNNILNVASDFVAKRLQINGGSSKEAVKDFIRAISQLKNSGKTQSFSEQFGTTSGELISAGQKVAPDLKIQKAEDLASLTAEQLTNVLAKVAEAKGIQGSAKAQTGTIAGLESNAKDAYSTLFESFFGIKKTATLDGNFVDIFAEGGLGSQAKNTIQEFINTMNGPGGDQLRKSLKELGTSLGSLLKQLITPENLKATFDGLKSVVDGMKSYLTVDNIKSFASAIGDFVKGIPGFVKGVGDVIEKIAATLGIKTEKVKSQEFDDYGNKVKKKTILTLPGGSQEAIFDNNSKTDLKRDQETIKKFDEATAKGGKPNELFNADLDLKNYEEAKKRLEDYNKFTDGKRKEDLVNLKQNEEDKRNAILETQRIIRAEIIKTVQESKINFDTMAIDSQNGFITLTNGAKVQLSEIGATSKNTTDEITLKFNQVKESLVQSFTDGRILSEPQIKLLAETSGKTIDEIKLKNEEIKTSLQEKFKTGKELSAIELQELAKLNNSTVETITKKHKEIILEEKFKSGKELSDIQLKELAKIHGTTVEEIKNKQKEIVENSSRVASGINSEFGKVNLQKAKDEFLGFGSLFAGIQREANNLLGTIKELAKNKDGTQTNNIGQAIGNIANNFARENGIIKKANGGLITGGSGVRDDVPLMAMGGEFVLTKNAVNKYGLNILNEINQGKIDLNTPKIESIRIPTAPSPRVSNAYNNQNNQKSQSITNVNNINVPNSGNFEHNLKNSLVLYADKLNRSLNSGFSDIAI